MIFTFLVYSGENMKILYFITLIKKKNQKYFINLTLRTLVPVPP